LSGLKKHGTRLQGVQRFQKVSENCYAERMAKRLKGRYGYPTDDPFRVAPRMDRLNDPIKWKKPKRIFVCSMGDLFHKDVDYEFLNNVFYVIRKCPQHVFQILTKRPERMRAYISQLVYKPFDEYFPNVWLGVTAENQICADDRIPVLLDTPAAIRFVSCEPLLEKIDLSLYLQGFIKTDNMIYKTHFSWCGGLDWVICGGETGLRAREIKKEWVHSLIDQCEHGSHFPVAFFFKQWNKKGDRLINNRIYEQYP